MYNQIFYSPPQSSFIKFLPHALKSGCKRAVLRERLFCSKCIIGKRVQVDSVRQGEGLGLLDVLVAILVDHHPPSAPSRSEQLGSTMDVLESSDTGSVS